MSKKLRKPGTTLPMVIAKAHNLSVQFAGFQMASAYLAAVSLSCISVVIGMCSQIVKSQPTWPSVLGYGVGFIVGVIAAFIFDGLTISSLKRMKTVEFGFNTITAFNLFFVIGGITFSTLAGDQMWALIFPKSPVSMVFAIAISAVLVATEMWPHQHEEAVKKSTARGDVLTFALSEESDEHVENLSRENRLETFADPEFRARIKAGTSDILEQSIIDKYKQLITPNVTEIVESDVTHLQQLPSPQDVKLLPEHVTPHEASEDNNVTQMSVSALQIPRGVKFSKPMDRITNPLQSVSNGSQQETEPLPELPEDVTADVTPDAPVTPLHGPTLDEKMQATVRLLNAIVGPNVTQPTPDVTSLPEDVTEPSVTSSVTPDAPVTPPSTPNDKLAMSLDALRSKPDITDAELAVILGCKRPASARFWRLKANEALSREAPVQEPVTGPLPTLRAGASETDKNIAVAYATMLKEGKKPSAIAIAERIGMSRQAVSRHLKAMGV